MTPGLLTVICLDMVLSQCRGEWLNTYARASNAVGVWGAGAYESWLIAVRSNESSLRHCGTILAASFDAANDQHGKTAA